MSGFDYVIVAIMLIVFLVMVAGLVVMAIGGKTNKKYSNKLMMMRVGAQSLVIFMLAAMFMLTR